jgi:predicted  nucleic acid-binding Zn-ribbon protein
MGEDLEKQVTDTAKKLADTAKKLADVREKLANMDTGKVIDAIIQDAMKAGLRDPEKQPESPEAPEETPKPRGFFCGRNCSGDFLDGSKPQK